MLITTVDKRWYFNLPVNRNVNYLHKRSGLLTDYFIFSMFWVLEPPPPLRARTACIF